MILDCWWVSGDGQSTMPMGQVDTQTTDAEEYERECWDDMLRQCSDDAERESILAGRIDWERVQGS